jgi:hypothetical protein
MVKIKEEKQSSSTKSWQGYAQQGFLYAKGRANDRVSLEKRSVVFAKAKCNKHNL